MLRPSVVALVVAAVVTLPVSVEAEIPMIDADGVPIIAVDLTAPDGPVAQTAAAEAVVDHGHEAVEVVAITVDDGGSRTLHPLPIAIAFLWLCYAYWAPPWGSFWDSSSAA